MSASKSEKQNKGKPEWSPKTEFFTSLSADGKYVICKTVITAIKPRAYFDKVLSGPVDRTAGDSAESARSEAESSGG